MNKRLMNYFVRRLSALFKMKLLPPLYLITLVLTTVSFSQALSQTPCGDCQIDLPELPADTLFLTAAPDGQTNVLYDADISFRVPMTTTPVAAVDTTVPPGIALSNIEINSLTNVPPGLEWELSQSVFDPTEETDGCIKFCGTPLQPGLYMVEVIITATVFIVDQTTSFSFPINILPATSDTEGFSMTNSSGCGEVQVDFENNIPSNGQEGFSYLWNFGNGNSSLEEHPAAQTYDEPGVYEVSYEATIDTIGYILTNVSVESTDCNDILGGAPDLKVDVIDPEGELIYVSDIIMNASPPVSWSFNIPIEEGNYTIKIVDDDSGLGGADDVCGTFNINQFSNGILVDGETTIDLTILNPVQTITSVDTVRVFEQPEDPMLLDLPEDPLCVGDSWTIATNYTEGLQWYQDSVPVLGADSMNLMIESSGEFWVTYTSPDGCQATSESVVIPFFEPPASPVFVNDNNLLSLFDTGILPDNYSLQWFLDDEAIENATELEYCIAVSGLYKLVLTNEDTGCESFYDLTINYDPDFENCITDTEEVLADFLNRIELYPNPARMQTDLLVDLKEAMDLEWSLINTFGMTLQYQQNFFPAGINSLPISLVAYPKGMYFLQIRIGNKTKTLKLLKQ
jgi:PKD repeat protein